ncbi:IS21 family transposase [Thioclava sp. A2]|uniref:IS21 family transposase n=1 Tax=Thioclava sp. FCG-A2 TaxID=3080562 RepID=UPI0029538AD0|nr:IS21 family transposase [Thioclava sp. A2]MDV7271925.1 IS21 family transposase [Thioclava sp. A2]
MITVETILKVRCDKHVHGKSIKEICRTRGLNRNTVRGILRSEETARTYKPRQKQPLPKLGDFEARLIELLKENEARKRKDRWRLTRICDVLQREGYEGGYDSVRRYANRWKQSQGRGLEHAFVPLWFAPGEAYQFDWSHETVIMGGVSVEVKVAHFRLCHSRLSFVVAYPRETQEMVFDAHNRAFAFFGGTCSRGIYDNMTTAVDAILIGKARVFNKRFLQMCSHFLIEPTACSPAAGWEKGQVENDVKNGRQRHFIPRLRVGSFEELNDLLAEQSLNHARTARHPEYTDRSIWDVFEDERAHLINAPVSFDGFREETVTVSKTCLVTFDRNRYSVCATAARKTIELKVYADRVVMRLDDKIIGEHPRTFGRDKTTYNPWHYVPLLERKPGALRNGAPFRDMELPSSMQKVRVRLKAVDDGDRQMVDILLAAWAHGLPAVEEACQEALASGLRSADAILNIVSRRQAVEPDVGTISNLPQHLTLTEEPIADCARYDVLRGLCHAAE